MLICTLFASMTAQWMQQTCIKITSMHLQPSEKRVLKSWTMIYTTRSEPRLTLIKCVARSTYLLLTNHCLRMNMVNHTSLKARWKSIRKMAIPIFFDWLLPISKCKDKVHLPCYTTSGTGKENYLMIRLSSMKMVRPIKRSLSFSWTFQKYLSWQERRILHLLCNTTRWTALTPSPIYGKL